MYPDFTCGGNTTCALSHNESSSSASARSAILRKVSGVASSPRTIREQPYFIGVLFGRKRGANQEGRGL